MQMTPVSSSDLSSVGYEKRHAIHKVQDCMLIVVFQFRCTKG